MEPPSGSRSATEIGRFLSGVEQERGLHLPDYEAAWSWSVDDLEGFWSAVWNHFGIKASQEPTEVLSSRDMPGRDSSSEHGSTMRSTPFGVAPDVPP